MEKLEVKDLKENFFEAIGKEWMLVTAGTKEKFNTMTASWGGIGWLWNKPVAFVFIRPERYTYEFVEKNDHLTLSFLGEENKKIHVSWIIPLFCAKMELGKELNIPARKELNPSAITPPETRFK